MGITTDANGYEIDLRERGLRVCDWCGLVMSEGYMESSGGGYACSQECLAADPAWITEPDEFTEQLKLPVMTDDLGNQTVHITNDLIGRWIDAEMNDGPECHIFWTDWEGDESSEDAVERLMREPYGYDHEDLHQIGWHDERSEMECNYCHQLFPSAREDAKREAIERGLDIIV